MTMFGRTGAERVGRDMARDSLTAGDRARDAGDWATAVARYEEHLAHAPDDAGIWVQLGNCAKESGRYDTSWAAYLRALELEPEAADTHLQLGHLSKIMRRPGQAVAYYRAALARNAALTDARHELTSLEQAIAAVPFMLPGTYLDLISANTVDGLIAACEWADSREDPFRLFAQLIVSK